MRSKTMQIFNLFSRRLKEESGEVPDTFQYDDIPYELRVQVVHIMDDGLGSEQDYHESYAYGDTRGIYKDLTSILRREYGVFHLTGEKYRDDNERLELINFLLLEEEVTKVLDVVELVCRAFEKVTDQWPGKFTGQAETLISELNFRFKERGVGYRYTSGSLVRIDSDFSHSEIVKPALSLLRDRKLQAVEKEFLDAHAHYRVGEYQDCLTDCGCSLESMMKIILEENGVVGIEKMAASKLAKTLFDRGIAPKELQTQFNSLQSLITSGVPTLRNKYSAHGHGARPIKIPEGIAAYCINLTATTLLLLHSFR
ncbi:STM4504/CBY_0614 family protein [Shimia thalassica]|uniref:STM4504/CBY_0614 family protein n=1 Tax=Shimia thalassica TaxID=1715693 RepID=UPI0026E296D0|nr:hypothetical protein [Shimia thalassica]MDO6482934.1 hypothetical protein [Shimia thalassica]